MTVLSAQTIRRLGLVTPCEARAMDPRTSATYGLGPHGYDIRLDQEIRLLPGGFSLASTVERFDLPANVAGFVHDKSTWARRGLAVQNTVCEAAWAGWLTLELTNHGPTELVLPEGTPIAQVVFHFLDEVTEQPYEGRYQRQRRGPVPAILEK